MIRVIAQPGLAGRDHNPYTWLLYRAMDASVTDFSFRRALAGRYDILHLHWPERELNACSRSLEAALRLRTRLALIDLLRARGTKLVWTVHNLASHERLHPRLESWFWSEFTSRLDGYIALSQAGRSAACARFPELERIPGYVIPHGHYRGEYPIAPASDARAELALPRDARVALFFGLIREYKNVPGLIAAFRAIEDRHLVLLIAGQPASPALAARIREQAQGDSRIHLHLQKIPNDRVQHFFRASDLVALPYRDILNSGTALLALSFDRPVLVPNLGAMSELQTAIGPDWVRTYPGELGGPELAAALRWAADAPRSSEAPLQSLEWSSLAAQTLGAYHDILAQRRPVISAVAGLVSADSPPPNSDGVRQERVWPG
jgi:glycosyltransferase involved in cell wall biosynthesis